MTAPRTASELRAYLRRELAGMGWCDVEVASEFEWKAARRLAREVGQTQGFRCTAGSTGARYRPIGLAPSMSALL